MARERGQLRPEGAKGRNWLARSFALATAFPLAVRLTTIEVSKNKQHKEANAKTIGQWLVS